jgi:hypothetical protein
MSTTTIATLHVVTAVSNPVRFRSRYALYRDFAKRVADAGATLTTVELAFGERPFEVTRRDEPRHLQLRTRDELWHKENLLNLGIAHAIQLDPDARYVAWVDADVQFARADWAAETVQQLQHYDVVQMFSHAQDVGPNYEPLQPHVGFAYAYCAGLAGSARAGAAGYGGDYCRHFHPGYAWAARREALDRVGGLIDWAVLGSADAHMATALVGRVRASCRRPVSRAYLRELLDWQRRAERHLRRNVGYVPGQLTHFWHGKKRDRRYVDRWAILARHRFDPDGDLRRDSQGLLALNDTDDPRQRELRDDVRRYFRSRNEDSVDLA